MLAFILILTVLLSFSCMYMFIRNDWVHKKKIELLKKCIPGSPEFEKQWNEYHSYWDYHKMIRYFWIWDINKMKEKL